MKKLGRPHGSYTQHRRLTQLRELLETHPKGLTIDDLASRLKVTDRSIRRYLRELGRDVDVDRSRDSEGKGTVVRIPTRDLPRRIKLHRTQIYGLLMARRVFKMLEGTTFEHVLGEAVDQLLAHVQRPPRRGAEIDPDTRLEDRFLYLPATPMRSLTESPNSAEVLDTIIDACAQLRECIIQYKKNIRFDATNTKQPKLNEATEALTIHPYAIVLYKDVVYCVCWVHERQAMRTLRVDRIVDADSNPFKHFELPAGFSVDAHFAGQFGVISGEKPTKVVIEFQPHVAEYVRSRLFPGEHNGQARYEELPNGGLRLHMLVGITAEVRSWVLSFGDTAKILEPKQFMDDIANELRGALKQYEQSHIQATIQA